MKFLLVNQPISSISLIGKNGDTSIHGDSIGLWNYHVANRLAEKHEVMIASNISTNQTAVTLPSGVKLRAVPKDLKYSIRQGRRFLARRLLNLLSGRRKFPFFATSEFCLSYREHIADVSREYQPDAVIVHNFFQLVPAIRKAIPSAKILLHMHCDWLFQLNLRATRDAVADSDYLCGCSAYIANRIAKRFPERADVVVPILNGVDVKLFQKNTQNSVDPGAYVRLLYVGRLSPEKGVHVLLRAFRKVTSKFPEVHLTLIGGRSSTDYDYICRLDDDPLIGDLEGYFRDNSKYQDHLEGLAHDLNVSFETGRPQADLVARYHSSDIFIFPSVWQEPFGMPLLEAMACGKPVVGTIGGGVPEFVENGETGCLVERGSVEQLTTVLLRLVENGAERRRLGTEAAKRIVPQHNWDAVASLVSSILRD